MFDIKIAIKSFGARRVARFFPIILSVLTGLSFFCIKDGYAEGLYAFKDARGVMHFTNVPTDPRYRLIRRYKNVTKKRYTAHNYAKIKLSELENVISNAARMHGLDPALIKAVIKAESDGIPSALSERGAMGLMQLMPDTAAGLFVSNPFDPESNIWGGAKYLRQMLDKFRGNVILALAAYNAGPGSVEKFGGIPPFPETREYVKRVLTFWQEYRARA